MLKMFGMLCSILKGCLEFLKYLGSLSCIGSDGYQFVSTKGVKSVDMFAFLTVRRKSIRFLLIHLLVLGCMMLHVMYCCC